MGNNESMNVKIEDKETLNKILIFLSFVGLFGSTVLSLFLINSGYEIIAKILFLWLPIVAIVIFAFLNYSLFKKYSELDEYDQYTLRKDAPQIIYILLGLVPIVMALMVGYAYAYLFKYGLI